MAEYIERESLMLNFERRYRDYRQRSEKPVGAGRVEIDRDLQMAACVMKSCLDTIHDVSAADVVEVRHGRWVEQEGPNMDTYYDCSACGESFCFIEGSPSDNLYLYCPNCGARMDGE